MEQMEGAVYREFNGGPMTLNQIMQAIEEGAGVLFRRGETPTNAYVGVNLFDPHDPLSPTHPRNRYQPGASIIGFHLQSGPIELKVVSGKGIRITSTPDPSADYYKQLAIRPAWSPEQLWLNDEGNRLLVKLAQNAEIVAFKRADTGEWDTTTTNDLLGLGFMPAFLAESRGIKHG